MARSPTLATAAELVMAAGDAMLEKLLETTPGPVDWAAVYGEENR